jgi:uncharacterized membrane protein
MYNLPGLGFIAFFLLVYLIGVVTTNVLGRHLVQWADRLFINIPIVKNIYLSSKQLADAFSPTKKGSFRQAVFVEFPQPGNYVLGFVTNELKDENGTKVRLHPDRIRSSGRPSSLCSEGEDPSLSVHD